VTTPLGGDAGGTFRIIPGKVREAGQAGHKVAGDIPDGIKTLHKPTDAAVQGLSGWQTAKEVDDCVEEWGKTLRLLAGMVEGAADAVIASARVFEDRDAINKGEFSGIVPPQPYIPGVSAYQPGPYDPGTSTPKSPFDGF
jgi:hypothetical protein